MQLYVSAQKTLVMIPRAFGYAAKTVSRHESERRRHHVPGQPEPENKKRKDERETLGWRRDMTSKSGEDDDD